MHRWVGGIIGGLHILLATALAAEDTNDPAVAGFPGLNAELVITGEYFHNLSGGLETGGGYRGDYSLFLNLDTEEAGLWDGGAFHLHLQAQHGNGITETRVGDAQTISNIDADDYAQISELYYEHLFNEGRHRIKLGKLEANADFAATDHGAGFINSSAGFSPTIPLTTYPDQDWGAMLEIGWTPSISTRFGIYQGRPNGGQSLGNTMDNLYGPMAMTESAWAYESPYGPGVLRAGAWWNGDRVEGLKHPDSIEDASGGVYGTWDHIVYASEDGDEAVGLFGQVGHSEPDAIEIDRYAGGGIEWRGPINGRSEDVAGIGLFYARFADVLDTAHATETALEIYYAAQLTERLLLKPDMQIVWHPGGTDRDTAFIVGLRAELVF